ALFTWEGGSGAIKYEISESESEVEVEGTVDPQGLVSDVKDEDTSGMSDTSDWLSSIFLEDMENNSTTEYIVELHDPLLERAKHEKAVTRKFYAVMMSK
ncbi:hypothetical protein IWQ61_010688, partial [Dispira simplex]